MILLKMACPSRLANANTTGLAFYFYYKIKETIYYFWITARSALGSRS